MWRKCQNIAKFPSVYDILCCISIYFYRSQLKRHVTAAFESHYCAAAQIPQCHFLKVLSSTANLFKRRFWHNSHVWLLPLYMGSNYTWIIIINIQIA